jgi:hypothetical protein
MFSSVNPSLAAVKMHKIFLSHAALGFILQDHGQLSAFIFRVKIAALGFLKKVIYVQNSYAISKEQSDFFSTTRQQKLKKPSAHIQNVLI